MKSKSTANNEIKLDMLVLVKDEDTQHNIHNCLYLLKAEPFTKNIHIICKVKYHKFLNVNIYFKPIKLIK